MRNVALLSFLLVVAVAGCSKDQVSGSGTAPAAEKAAVPSNSPVTAPDSYSSTSTADASGGEDLKKLETEQSAAKSAYEKQHDAAAKSAYVVATVKLATASMTSEALDRKVKYKRALSLYREALKADPKNTEAQNNAKLIEDVYKSMGRPVP